MIDYASVDDDFVVAIKPSGIPTVPLKGQEGSSLLSLVSLDFPEVVGAQGRKEWEGLTLHRLDTLTSGLVVFARNARSYKDALALQEEGRFIKTYRAYYSQTALTDGFEPFPYAFRKGEVLSSAFRAYGVGRKAVRPVLNNRRHIQDNSVFYYTRIDDINPEFATLSLAKGFRHQVRAHMAWSGHALRGDELYGGVASSSFGLVATRIELDGFVVTLPF